MINGFFVKFVDVVSQSTDFNHRMSYWFTEVHRQVVAFKIKALYLYFVYLLQYLDFQRPTSGPQAVH